MFFVVYPEPNFGGRAAKQIREATTPAKKGKGKRKKGKQARQCRAHPLGTAPPEGTPATTTFPPTREIR